MGKVWCIVFYKKVAEIITAANDWIGYEPSDLDEIV